MVNFGPLAVGFGSLVCGTPANFNKFRVLAALLHGTQPNCGIEQRAPPIFGRAAIILGTGPHSRVSINKGCYFWFVSFVFLWFITGSFVWFLQDVIEPDFSCVKCRMWMKNGAIDSDPVFVSRPLYSFGVGSLMALTLILSSVAISVSGYCYFCVRSLLFLCQVTVVSVSGDWWSCLSDPLLATFLSGWCCFCVRLLLFLCQVTGSLVPDPLLVISVSGHCCFCVRSLVALSLILSLLLFKPAPLYILDEVDAALDLSHTQNIGQMLKTHFRHSQVCLLHSGLLRVSVTEARIPLPNCSCKFIHVCPINMTYRHGMT